MYLSDELLSETIVIILLVLHVGFIALWFGLASILSSIVIPSLGKISQSSKMEFLIAALPRFARFIVITSTGSVLAGILLFGYETRIATAFAPSPTGTLYIEAGAGLGFIAYILAIAVAYPTANRLTKALKQAVEKQDGASSDIPRLQVRMRMTAGAIAGLLGLTLILMVIGATV